MSAKTKTSTTAQHAKVYTFDQALRAFAKSVNGTMRFARMCSELALKHYAQHGDYRLLQRFLDAMPANFRASRLSSRGSLPMRR
jgi:hypothetical protein